jgi:hypothetical protein
MLRPFHFHSMVISNGGENGMDTIKRFEALKKDIDLLNKEKEWFDPDPEYLTLSEHDGLISIDFYGFPFTERFTTLLDILSEEAVASQVQRLFFHSPDKGANGTRPWDFRALLNKPILFPKLIQLSIEWYEVVNHNRPIVGDDYDHAEQGMLANWLSKAPELIFLSAPSAPNKAFFERPRHPLERLNIQAGFDTQDFVLNFAHSNCFPEMWRFEYQDYNEDYIQNYQENCTPFTHFYELFQSPAFASIRVFVWHNPIFAMDDLSKLKALRPDLHFMVVRSSKEYVK